MLPDQLFIKFLSPKTANIHQTEDMGMLAYLKAVNKSLLLIKLLEIFDDARGFEHAVVQRAQ